MSYLAVPDPMGDPFVTYYMDVERKVVYRVDEAVLIDAEEQALERLGRSLFGGAVMNIKVMEMALDSVRDERLMQEEYKAAGRFKYTPADEGPSSTDRLAMITEEVGEASKHALSLGLLVADSEGSTKGLYKELTQVAALAVAWMEYLMGDEDGD